MLSTLGQIHNPPRSPLAPKVAPGNAQGWGREDGAGAANVTCVGLTAFESLRSGELNKGEKSGSVGFFQHRHLHRGT